MAGEHLYPIVSHLPCRTLMDHHEADGSSRCRQIIQPLAYHPELTGRPEIDRPSRSSQITQRSTDHPEVDRPSRSRSAAFGFRHPCLFNTRQSCRSCGGLRRCAWQVSIFITSVSSTPTDHPEVDGSSRRRRSSRSRRTIKTTADHPEVDGSSGRRRTINRSAGHPEVDGPSR